MIYTLTGITKRSKYIYYHVCCTFPDGRIKYLEMRRESNQKTMLYLNCIHRPTCSAKLSIMFKDPIKTEKNGRSFYFTQEVTEEMLMNQENYDGVFHRHTARCFSTVDSDGQCRTTKHKEDCYKKIDQQKKVSFNY